MNVTIIGAGNVGRGFLGLEMYLRKNHVRFVDADKKLVEKLREPREYEVHFVGNNEKKNVRFQEIYHTSDVQQVIQSLRESDVILTSVGATNLPKIAEVVAEGIISERKKLIVACENTPQNSFILQTEVSHYLQSPENYAEFANCIIDRICISKNDKIIVEPNFEWIVETESNLLEAAQGVRDLEPYFRRKLFLVNGIQSIIGSIGTYRGIKYTHEVLQNQEFNELISGVMEEMKFGLEKEFHVLEPLDYYIGRTIKRLSNPVLMDETQRLVREPVRKLQKNERLMGSALLSLKHGKFPEDMCRGIAYVLKYQGDSQGRTLQNSIKEKGVRKTLEEITGVESILFERIAEKYELI